MAWNDPDWGKKGAGGPPDLDEVWRRFNEKLNSMFGGKGRGPGGPRPVGGDGQAQRSGAWLLIAIAFLIWIGSGFYIVNERERGVVLRFGKYVETTMPGPRWHLPYPIETVEIVDTQQIRVTEVGYRQNDRGTLPNEAAMLTSDKNIINVLFAVQYLISDPQAYLFNNIIGDDQAFVRQVAESAMREAVGKTNVDAVLAGSTGVANEAGKAIQEILNRYATGITVVNVTVAQVQPPEQVQAAFNDAIKADQDRERQKNEGEAYANNVIPRAKGTAARLLEEAEGYRQSVIAKAEGDAARFRQLVAEYNKAPGVTRDRLYIEAMQEIYSNTTKVFVDQKAGNNLLYLPLDKLIQRAAAEPGPSVGTASPSEPARPVDPVQDSLRGREREARP